VCVQVMEGSEGKSQEDDLELLEGASIKPDWQVSQLKDQSGKGTLLVCLLGFSWCPDALSGLDSCNVTQLSEQISFGGHGKSAVMHSQRSCTVSGHTKQVWAAVSA